MPVSCAPGRSIDLGNWSGKKETRPLDVPAIHRPTGSNDKTDGLNSLAGKPSSTVKVLPELFFSSKMYRPFSPKIHKRSSLLNTLLTFENGNRVLISCLCTLKSLVSA